MTERGMRIVAHGNLQQAAKYVGLAIAALDEIEQYDTSYELSQISQRLEKLGTKVRDYSPFE